MMTDSASSPLLTQPDAMTAPADWPPADPLAMTFSWSLDPFQQHAILAIHASKHVFVTAKTGSGKTLPGEYLCAYWLARGRRVFYTTPIKSLSNQKYHDLRKLFPAKDGRERVGILTGDIKMCPDADIVVMTAEILRNLLYKRGTATEGVGLSSAVSLDRVAGIVMDEAHYIQDPDRGHVWEETLVLCPPDLGLQLVLLSATLPSPEPLARWLAVLHNRPTCLLSTTYRVVPLVHGVLEPTETGGHRVRPLLDVRGAWISEGYAGWLAARRGVEDAVERHKKAVAVCAKGKQSGGGGLWSRAEHDRAHDAASAALRSGKVVMESPTARLQRTVQWLAANRQLPALFFVFSRRECERLAANVGETLLDAPESAEAVRIMDFHLSRHRAELERSPQYHALRDVLVRGVAFHHSGLNPLLKEIVEILFTRGLIKALFATETFAVGLNMPTKTVVFLELEKFDGTESSRNRPLRPDEYIQMAGRAGRRGMDTQGLVLYEPLHNPLDSATLRTMMTGALPPLESRMRFGYDYVLRLKLMAESGSEPESGPGPVSVAEKSYWAAQRRDARAALEDEWTRTCAKIAAVEIAPDVEALLNAKAAIERTIATTVNSKQNRARKELVAWNAANADRLPTLATAESRLATLTTLRTEAAALDRERSRWTPLFCTGAQESLLASWGFLAEGALTPLGRAATEVNEGHPLLMPWLLAESMPMSPEDIPIVLAMFLRESSASGSTCDAREDWRTCDSFSEAVDTARFRIQRQAKVWAAEEARVVTGDQAFWSLSRDWPIVVTLWQAGNSIPAIATLTGIMEGNIQRSLLRVANLLEEWRAIATLRSDLPTLEALSSLTFLRGELVCDSLYLRL